MPIATIDVGANRNYEVLGTHGPWIWRFLREARRAARYESNPPPGSWRMADQMRVANIRGVNLNSRVAGTLRDCPTFAGGRCGLGIR